MRKLIVLSFLTLDGVVQQDPSDGFPYGEWDGPFWDEFLDQVMLEQMSKPYDLVLGRKTYDTISQPNVEHPDEENSSKSGDAQDHEPDQSAPDKVPQ